MASRNVGFFLRLNLNLELTDYGGYALKLVSRLLAVPTERLSAASRCFSNDLCHNLSLSYVVNYHSAFPPNSKRVRLSRFVNEFAIV